MITILDENIINKEKGINKTRTGISLIILMITIIIIIILAGVTIVTFNDNKIIDVANETVFKNNISVYNETLGIYHMSQKLDEYKYEPNKLDANSLEFKYNDEVVAGKNIYDIIPRLEKDDNLKGKLEVKEGKLVFVGEDVTEQEWAEDLIELGRLYIDIATVANKNSIDVTVELTGTAIVDSNTITTILSYSLDRGNTFLTENITGSDGNYTISNLPNNFEIIVKVKAEARKLGEANPFVVKEKITEVIKAEASLEEYTVRYDANGGINIPSSQTKIEGKTLKLSSFIPTREGYTFEGWATSSIGSIKYAPGSNYTTDSNLTLYAIWRLIPVDASGIRITVNPTTPAKSVKVTITNIPDNLNRVEYKQPNTNLFLKYTIGSEITVTENGTLEVRIVGTNGASDTITKQITNIDNERPSKPIITGYTSAVPTKENVVLTFYSSSSDVAGYEYRIGSGSYIVATSPLTLTNEMNDIVYIRAKDNAGNYSEDSEITVIIDKTAPTKPKYTISPTTPINGNVTVSGIFSENPSTKQYKIGSSGTWTTYTKAIVLESNNTVYFREIDSAGNISSEAGAVVTNIDKTAPSVPTIINSSNGVWTNVPITVTVTSTDLGTGIARYEWSRDNKATWATTSLVTSAGKGNITFTDEKNQIVYFRAIDNAGNISGVASTTIKIDKTLPIVSFGTNGSSASKSVSTKVTVGDIGSGIINNSLKCAWSTSNTTPPTISSMFLNGSVISKSGVNGTYYLWIRGEDYAGNVTTVVSNAFVLDNTAPNVSGVSATFNPEGFTNGSITATITGITSDMTTVTYTSQNQPTLTVLPSNKQIIVHKNGSIQLKISDKAGNTSTKVIHITNIDKLNPIATLQGINITDKSFTLVATGADSGATVDYGNSGIFKYQIYINEVLVYTRETSTGTLSYDVLSKTPSTMYNCKVIVTDRAGNQGIRTLNVTTNKEVSPIGSKVKAGDYIKYNSGTSYTGHWRVLYDGTYSTNGNRIEIISEENVEDKYTIGNDDRWSWAADEYADMIKNLNAAANVYLNGAYADRARCVGSNPYTPEYRETISTDNMEYYEHEGYLERYGPENETHHEDDVERLKAIGEFHKANVYWLASRAASTSFLMTLYSARCVRLEGIQVMYIAACVNMEETYNDFTPYNAGECGLRPVISIKKEVTITDGKGTKEEPYILN